MRPSGDAAVRKAQLALSRVLYIQICASHKHSQFHPLPVGLRAPVRIYP